MDSVTSGDGHIEFAHVLLGHGADTTAQDKQGCTPMYWLSYGGHAEVARILLEHEVPQQRNNHCEDGTTNRLGCMIMQCTTECHHEQHTRTARILLILEDVRI
jgi:ankyrin repeat protein